jgi:hypothetical protein
MSCRTLCWPPNCHWLVTVLPEGNVRLQLFFTAFLMLVGRGEGVAKIVEIDQSCFIRRKCNCSGLRVRAWVFVDIERELGTPVLNPSLIALPRHYSPSLKCVSNVVPQPSVTAGGTTFRLLNEGLTHHSVDLPIIFVTHWCSHKYDQGHMEAHQHSPQALLRKQN